MKRIDLNCDMGEMPDSLVDGTQEELMRYVSSANVACGGHAGNPEMMRATIGQALRYGVGIGAHPGYEDAASFGRKELQLLPDEISASVYRQIAALEQIAQQCGAAIGHVKAHGALYNQAARDREIARAIAIGVGRWHIDVVLVGLAGSIMLDEFRAAGFPVAAEAFADRRYENDGSLRSRKYPDALLHSPEDAANQALQIIERGCVTTVDGSTVPLQADSICIHGDTPGAVEIAAAVSRRIREAGIAIQSMSPRT
jgi:5-oxoprolinase (ATP-hydrolysing) subunit A